MLGGRCRRCREPISAQYPIVELVTGVALRRWSFGSTPDRSAAGSRLMLVCILIVLFVIDLEHQILPNVITLPGIVVGSSSVSSRRPAGERR